MTDNSELVTELRGLRGDIQSLKEEMHKLRLEFSPSLRKTEVMQNEKIRREEVKRDISRFIKRTSFIKKFKPKVQLMIENLFHENKHNPTIKILDQNMETKNHHKSSREISTIVNRIVSIAESKNNDEIWKDEKLINNQFEKRIEELSKKKLV